MSEGSDQLLTSQDWKISAHENAMDTCRNRCSILPHVESMGWAFTFGYACLGGGEWHRVRSVARGGQGSRSRCPASNCIDYGHQGRPAAGEMENYYGGPGGSWLARTGRPGWEG